MIEIETFEKAYEMYANGQLPLNVLKHQAVPLFENVPSEITEEDINKLLASEAAIDRYDSYLGGSVYICETLDDLKQVEGCDLDYAAINGGRWPNVTDMAMGVDLCEYLEGDPKFIVFLLCWNNAGGPVYYIPESLWIPNVKESVELTKKMWSVANANTA